MPDERTVPGMGILSAMCNGQRRRAGVRSGHAVERVSLAAGLLVQVGGLRREALAVCRRAQAVVGLEAAGEVVLVRPADRAADAGDRLAGVQEHDGGVLG